MAPRFAERGELRDGVASVRAILGIDAAWTPRHPTGIALIRQVEQGEWECVAIAHILTNREPA